MAGIAPHAHRVAARRFHTWQRDVIAIVRKGLPKSIRRSRMRRPGDLVGKIFLFLDIGKVAER